MEQEKESKMKNLPVQEDTHAKIAALAKQKGMTIQALTEKMIKDWIEVNVFFDPFANSVSK